MDNDESTANLELDELGEGNNPPEEEAGSEKAAERLASDLEAVYDVPVQISAILGHSEVEVSQLLKLDEGAVIELDRKVGEAIDIFVNNRLIARGEVVQVENKLGITMTEIIKNDGR